ncbi:MAG: hypothetical protein A2579_02205 [Lysobacterales bacterium RIFOXYD1_FULL_69_11]|nr:MAG: hypothetical protein A2579_02205 [Xanthomonadales bacterium RIFOXYD1_FULL_69_11]
MGMLAAGVAWGAEGAGAAAATKGFDKAAGEALAWPSPWTVGTTLVYDQHYESIEGTGEGRVRLVGTDVTEIAVVEGPDGGIVQRWTGRDPEMTGEGLPEAMQPVMEAAVESFRVLPLDIAINEDGSYRAITNLEVVLPLYRTLLEQAMEAGIPAGGGEAALTDVETAEYRKVMAVMIDAMTSPEIIEPELASTPAALNFVATGGLVAGRRYIFDDTYDNPLGAGEISARHSLLLEPIAETPGRVRLEWTSQPDSAGVVAALESFVQATFEEALGEEALQAAIDDLAAGAHFSTEVRYEVDVATGRIERMEMVETQHLPDSDSVETTRLILRN